MTARVVGGDLGGSQMPDVFGRVLVESPSFWHAGGRFLEDVRRHTGPWPERMFLAMGTREYSGTRQEKRPDVDKLLSDYFLDCVHILEKRGLRKEQHFDWWLQEGAAHNEADWARCVRLHHRAGCA